MKTSAKGAAFLVAGEGVVPAPYLDSKGICTYGIGHTSAAGAPTPATMTRGMPSDLDAALREVFAVFRHDLQKYEAEVLKALGRTPMLQHEFDAAVSFHFNTGAITRAAWVDLWKSGRKDAAAKSMLANWRKPKEIIERRTAERDLFLTGDYGSMRATVWRVSKAGVITWKAARTLTQAEILALMAEATGRKAMPTIRRGSRGDDVALAQRALGIPDDGIFGPATEAAAIAFQKSAGLTPDGIIGAHTWAALIPE